MRNAIAVAAVAVLISVLLSGCLGKDFCIGLGQSGCPMYAPPPPWMNEACDSAGGHWTADGPDFLSCCMGPPHCVDANGHWLTLNQTPTPTPVSTPVATATPWVGASPTPTPSTRLCEEIIRDRIYSQYRPAYCTGVPPCTPLNESQVKAKILVDVRSSPTVAFTYEQGNQCSVITYTGRAWIVPETCELHDIVITGQTTVSVPC